MCNIEFGCVEAYAPMCVALLRYWTMSGDG